MNATTCPLCSEVALPEQKYCARCEQLLSGTKARQPAKPKWYHNVWFVLFMLSPFALGPFGLPLLWKSPRFSQSVKAGLTIFTIVWTALACWYVIVVVVPAVTKEVNQLNSTFSF